MPSFNMGTAYVRINGQCQKETFVALTNALVADEVLSFVKTGQWESFVWFMLCQSVSMVSWAWSQTNRVKSLLPIASLNLYPTSDMVKTVLFIRLFHGVLQFVKLTTGKTFSSNSLAIFKTFSMNLVFVLSAISSVCSVELPLRGACEQCQCTTFIVFDPSARLIQNPIWEYLVRRILK